MLSVNLPKALLPRFLNKLKQNFQSNPASCNISGFKSLEDITRWERDTQLIWPIGIHLVNTLLPAIKAEFQALANKAVQVSALDSIKEDVQEIAFVDMNIPNNIIVASLLETINSEYFRHYPALYN